MRPGVGPRPDQALARGLKTGNQSRNRVRVSIRPASDRVDGGLDAAPVLAHGAMCPLPVATLMAEPAEGPRHKAVEAFEPDFAPSIADDLRVGRPGIEGKHRGCPGEVVCDQATAHVVDVVGIPVIRRARRDYGFQRWRPKRRDLQPIEAAPGDAGHSDRAGAPFLRCEPGDDVNAVLEFLLEILVFQEALGVAAAPQVYPRTRISVSCPEAVSSIIAEACVIAAAIRNIFQDRRHRRALGTRRNPEPGCQSAAIPRGDPCRLDSAHTVFHACSLHPSCPSRFMPELQHTSWLQGSEALHSFSVGGRPHLGSLCVPRSRSVAGRQSLQEDRPHLRSLGAISDAPAGEVLHGLTLHGVCGNTDQRPRRRKLKSGPTS